MTANAVSARPGRGGLPLLAIGAAVTIAAAGLVLALSSRPQATTVPTPAAAATVPPASSASRSIVMETSPPPTWTGQRQPGWGPDGSRTITFELQAAHDVPVWMSRARPVLVVQCWARATRAYVVLGTSVKFESDAYRRTVQLQWDDGPLTSQQWNVSDGGQELFAPDGIAFVRQLARGRHLRFGFTPFNAQGVTAEFAVQGFDQRGGLVARTCGWRLDG